MLLLEQAPTAPHPIPALFTLPLWAALSQAAYSMQAGAYQKDACAAVINVPKIAMLFLATKGFPHAAMWSMWFQQIRGLVPRDCAAQAFCPGGRTQGDAAGFNELIQACSPSRETPGEPTTITLPADRQREHTLSLEHQHRPALSARELGCSALGLRWAASELCPPSMPSSKLIEATESRLESCHLPGSSNH